MYNLRKEKVNIKFVLIATSILCLFLTLFSQSDLSLILMILILSLALLVSVKKNYLLVLLFLIIFYCNYSFIVLNYLDTTEYIFTRYQNSFISFEALRIMLIFLLVIYWLMPKKINEVDENNLYYSKKMHLIFHIMLMICIIGLIVFGYTSDAFGIRGNQSTIFGYVALLLLVGFYFSNNRKYIKYIYSALAIIFICKNLLHGERLYALQSIFLLYIYMLPKKIKTNYLLISFICVLGYLGLNFIAEARTIGWNFDAFGNAIKNSFLRLFSLDTVSSSMFTSQTFIDVAARDTVITRLYLFIIWIASIFVGGSLLPKSNLPVYTNQIIAHYGGGILPYYGFYYLSYLGVILFALLIVFFIKLTMVTFNSQKNKKFSSLLSIYFVITIFSWYLYSPSALTRGMLLLIIVYYFSVLIDKILSKIHKKGN